MRQPTPLVFDGCFGWFHPAGGSRGVVICSPHGYEDLLVHRILRLLADQLAAAGLPTLRFDYPGAGDSPGSDEDPDRVRAWLDGIHAAVRWIRTNAGVEQVALIGLRLGGTLAAAAAEEIGGVDSLALLASPATGKAYLRELKALTMLAPTIPGAPPPRPEWKSDLEAAGFVISAETQAELGKISLLQLQTSPAPRVLMLHREDAPVDDRVAARLRALGAEVREAPFAGYTEMMRDAHFARPPRETFALLTSWLAEGARPGPLPPSRAEPAVLSLPDSTEEAVFFGERGLFGIYSAPLRPDRERPAVLFLNTGSIHHVGSNRMSVAMARRLAARGVPSLRFDVAGMGDSPTGAGELDNRLYERESFRDVVAAVDWLQTRDHNRCTAVGLCSGAYLAFYSAIEEPRVVGQVLINAQRFTWHPGDSLEIAMRKSYKSTRFYVETALRPETWRRVLTGRVNILGITTALVARAHKRLRGRFRGAAAGLLGGRTEKGEVARGFHLLSDRGVETLMVYSAQDGSLDELDAHLGKGGRELKGRTNVRIEILEGADHTLTARWARERLATLLEEHLGVRTTSLSLDRKEAQGVF